MNYTVSGSNVFDRFKFKNEQYIATLQNTKPAAPVASAVVEPKPEKEKFNSTVALATAVGTILPILLIRKYQGKSIPKGSFKNVPREFKNLMAAFKPKDGDSLKASLKKADIKSIKDIVKSFHIEYELKEMLLVSFSSILGGIAGGLIGDKEEKPVTKVKEGVFQFINVAIPTSIVAGLLGVTGKYPKLSGTLPKIAAVALGIGGGMPLAAVVSNTINNKVVDTDCKTKRELKLKDCFVHVDDVLGAILLAKGSLVKPAAGAAASAAGDVVEGLVSAVLPFLYASCGYEAGTKKEALYQNNENSTI